MADAFSIEALSTSVTIGEDEGEGEVSVEVTNSLARHVRVGLEVRGAPPLDPSWVRPEPSTFGLAAAEGRRVTVVVAPPAEAAVEGFRFTLRAFDVDRPADAFAESAPISVSLRRREPREPRLPPGLLLAIAAWFGGGALGVLLGGFLGPRLASPGEAQGETFAEALESIVGGAVHLVVVTVLTMALLAWLLSTLAVWLALRLRGLSRPLLTALLSAGLCVPWVILVILAFALMDAVAVLGLLMLLVLLAASPPAGARLLALWVNDRRTAEQPAA